VASEITQPVRIDDKQANEALKRLAGRADEADDAFDKLAKQTPRLRDEFGRFISKAKLAEMGLDGLTGSSSKLGDGLGRVIPKGKATEGALGGVEGAAKKANKEARLLAFEIEKLNKRANFDRLRASSEEYAKAAKNARKASDELKKSIDGTASKTAASGVEQLAASTGKSKLAMAGLAGAVALGANALIDLGGRALGAAQSLGAMVLEGEKVKGVIAGFKAIGGTNKDLEELRQATSGLVSDGDLARIANQARLFNIPPDQIANLTKLAVGAGTLMGMDTAKAAEDIFTGIARGSVMIIDNLGISLGKLGKVNADFAKSVGKAASDLTQEEKQMALIQATIAGGQRQIAAAEIGGFGASEAAVGFENLTQKLQMMAAEIFNTSGISKLLVEGFQKVGEFATANSGTIRKMMDAGVELGKTVGALLLPNLMEMVPVIEAATTIFGEIVSPIQFAAAALGKLSTVATVLAGGGLKLLADGLKLIKGENGPVLTTTKALAPVMREAEAAIKAKAKEDKEAAEAAKEHSKAVEAQISGAELATKLAGAQAEAEAVLAKSTLNTAEEFKAFTDAQAKMFADTTTGEERADALADSIKALGGSLDDQMATLDQYTRSQNSMAQKIAEIDARLLKEHGVVGQTELLFNDLTIALERQHAIRKAMNLTEAQAEELSGRRVENLIEETAAQKAITAAILKKSAEEDNAAARKKRRGARRKAAEAKKKEAQALAEAERAGRIALMTEIEQTAVGINERYNKMIFDLKGQNAALATELARQRDVDLASLAIERGVTASEEAAKIAAERAEAAKRVIGSIGDAYALAAEKIEAFQDRLADKDAEAAASMAENWQGAAAVVGTSFVNTFNTMAQTEGSHRERMAKGMGSLFGELSTAFMAWAVAEGNLLSGNPFAAAIAAAALGSVAAAISAFGARKPPTSGGGGAASRRALDREQDREEVKPQTVIFNYGFQAPQEVEQEVARAQNRASRRSPRRAA
jgi:hypothetical protein